MQVCKRHAALRRQTHCDAAGSEALQARFPSVVRRMTLYRSAEPPIAQHNGSASAPQDRESSLSDARGHATLALRVGAALLHATARRPGQVTGSSPPEGLLIMSGQVHAAPHRHDGREAGISACLCECARELLSHHHIARALS